MILYPAIDIRGGKAVRLLQGDYARETTYDADPVDAAKRWAGEGAEFLHVVDLDGAKAGEPRNLESVRRIAAAVECPIQVGGGLRDAESVAAILNAGAERVVIGTAALRNPAFLAEALAAYGERVVVSVDARNGKVALEGWTKAGEEGVVEAVAELSSQGVARFLCTAIEVDGTMEGPAIGELNAIAATAKAEVIASGGVGNLSHLEDLSRRAAPNIEGAIVGRALYERRFTVAEGIAAPCGDLEPTFRYPGTRHLAVAMVLKRVIPCLDVDSGRVVKGTNFVGLRDAGDPVELAERYDAEGADELVFLDITASHEKRETIVELARRTADNVFIPFTIGGGIGSVEDAQAVLDAGADKVSVNSAALARPQLLAELADHFGAQCVVIAIDAKREEDGWGVYVNGGRRRVEGRDAVSWAVEAVERGRRRGAADQHGPRRDQRRLRHSS